MFNFKQIYNTNVFDTIIIIFIILYIALLKPDLSKNIKVIFNNTIFKMIFLFYIVYISNTKPYMALLLTLAFVLTLDCIHVMDSKEAFKSIENFTRPMQIQSANIGEKCNISTICNPGTCDLKSKKCIQVKRR